MPTDRDLAESDGTDTLSARLSDDTLYAALSATPRRRVLYHLLANEESSLDELATVLSGWNTVDEGDVATERDHEEWALALRHVHLPLLADAGLVTHDPETETAELADLGPSVRSLIENSIAAERTTGPE